MRWASARFERQVDDRRAGSPTPAWAVAGFALGAMAGWLLSEWTGGVSRSRVASLVGRIRRTRPDPAAPSTPRERIQIALETDPDLHGLALRLLPAGRAAIELHGWVPSRRLRSRATRLAAVAAGNIRLVDCLLVRGEDDRPTDDGDAGASRSA
jgi:hypothetical protein